MAALAPLSGLLWGPTCLGCFDVYLAWFTKRRLTFDGVFQILSLTQPNARTSARAYSPNWTGSLNVLILVSQVNHCIHAFIAQTGPTYHFESLTPQVLDTGLPA